MKDEKRNPVIKEGLERLKQDFGFGAEEKNTDREKPSGGLTTEMKVSLGIAGVFVLLWSSKYILSALAGAVRSFKELKRSLREK